MMKFIRWLLGKIILTLDWIFSPTPVERDPIEQKKVDEVASSFSLYEFRACPFCVKVRRFLRAANVRVPIKDAKAEPFRTELLQQGGKLQVPCLRIAKADGSAEWLYESSDIISYLKRELPIK